MAGTYDYNRSFAQNGAKADISDDVYKGGWFDVVGGLNGIPTTQQFNAIMNHQENKINETHKLAEQVKGKMSDMYSYNADTKTLTIVTGNK